MRRAVCVESSLQVSSGSKRSPFFASSVSPSSVQNLCLSMRAESPRSPFAVALIVITAPVAATTITATITTTTTTTTTTT
ncbi:hypothetical protein GQ42DRAFT_163759, partial [Ramicandelaber brevisporus]